MNQPHDIPATVTPQAAALRQQAEQALEATALATEDLAALPPEVIRRMFHELQVRQIVLEVQNEELRRAQPQLAEEALRASEARYRSLLEAMEEGFALHEMISDEQGNAADYRFLEVNPAFGRLTGLDTTTLAGRTVREVVPGIEPAWIERYGYVVRTGQSERFEDYSAGLDRWFDVFAYSPSPGQFAVAFTDINERKASEERHRLLVETMLQGVVQQDASGTIIAMNPAAERILGKTSDQFLGSNSVREEHQTIREDDSPFPGLEHPAMVALQTGQTVRGVVMGVFNPQLGAHRWIRIDGVPLFRPRETRPAEVYTVFEDITEHKQAEEELRSSEAFLNTLLEQSPHTMWISNAHGTLVRTNQAMRDMFQVTDEEVVGKYNLLQDEIVQDQGFIQQVRDVFEKGKSAQFCIAYDTSRLKHLKLVNPKYLYLDVTISPILGASGEVTNAVIQHLDITDRKRAELKLLEWNAALDQQVAERTLELQDSEARFRQLADATFEGIAISEAGILLDGNLRLAEIHGFELAEMLGRPVVNFIAPESQPLVAGQILDGRDMVYECLGLRKDGSVFPEEIHARMGTWMGKTTRITALRDLTAIKRAAAKLQGLQTELGQVERLALVSEINAGIVHQIAQPLSAIGANLSGLIKLKAHDLQRCDALATVKDVEADVIRMRDIVRHLHKLVGQGPRTSSLTKLNTIVTEVHPLLRQKADSRGCSGCSIAVELDNDDAAVHVDAVQLTQVILNLVSNALDASGSCPEERREIRITTRWHCDKAVELCVRDAGTGIAPETLNRLFTPFFSTKPDGLGVGLRLAQTIVQAHGGRIEGYNNPDGAGATFRVVVPAH